MKNMAFPLLLIAALTPIGALAQGSKNFATCEVRYGSPNGSGFTTISLRKLHFSNNHFKSKAFDVASGRYQGRLEFDDSKNALTLTFDNLSKSSTDLFTKDHASLFVDLTTGEELSAFCDAMTSEDALDELSDVVDNRR